MLAAHVYISPILSTVFFNIVTGVIQVGWLVGWVLRHLNPLGFLCQKLFCLSFL